MKQVCLITVVVAGLLVTIGRADEEAGGTQVTTNTFDGTKILTEYKCPFDFDAKIAYAKWGAYNNVPVTNEGVVTTNEVFVKFTYGGKTKKRHSVGISKKDFNDTWDETYPWLDPSTNWWKAVKTILRKCGRAEIKTQ